MIRCFRHCPLRLFSSADRRCRICQHASDVSSKPPSRTPRPRLFNQIIAGLLTCGSMLGHPSRPKNASGCLASLTAYSCGGNHGLGAGRQPHRIPFFIPWAHHGEPPKERVPETKKMRQYQKNTLDNSRTAACKSTGAVCAFAMPATCLFGKSTLFALSVATDWLGSRFITSR